MTPRSDKPEDLRIVEKRTEKYDEIVVLSADDLDEYDDEDWDSDDDDDWHDPQHEEAA